MFDRLQEVDVKEGKAYPLAALSEMQLALIGGGTGDATLC